MATMRIVDGDREAEGFAESVRVLVSLLRIDYTYQRPTDSARVERMARDFDPRLCGHIKVSRRADGYCYIMDGQHRYLAALKAGYLRIPCEIYHGLDIPQEAAYFYEWNTSTKKPSLYELHRAAVAQGSTKAAEIDAILAEYGCRLVERGMRGRACVMAVETVQRIYTSRHGGAKLLREVFGIVSGAWSLADPIALRGEILWGLARFLIKCQGCPGYRPHRLLAALGRNEPAVIMRRARDKADALRLHTSTGVMLVIRELYNSGARGGSRLPVFDPLTFNHTAASAEEGEPAE